MSKHVSFNIAGVQQVEFSNRDPFNTIPGFKADNPLDAGVNINYRWNLKKEIFAVATTFTYVYGRKKNNPVELLKFSFIIDYHVNNLSEIFTARNADDFTIDESWEKSFVGLAISTGRGLLLSKCAGTFYGNIIFPVVDPAKIILSRNRKNKK